MSKKVSITLDDEILDFIDQHATNRNRSGFINALLWQEKQKILIQELALAYQDQAEDAELQTEIDLWDVVVGDGLNAQGNANL